MKILHCIDALEAPGVAELLAQLQAHAGPAGPVHLALTLGSLPASWHDPLRIAALRSAIERARADVVQSHGFFSALAASFAAGAPVLHTLHVPFHHLPWWQRRGWRRLLARGAAAVAISAAVRRSFVFGAGARAREIETIPLGFGPLPDAVGWRAKLAAAVAAAPGEASPGELLVGAPEPPSPRSGHGFLLEAWAALPAGLRAGARLVLRAELAELAEGLPACDVVVWSSLYGELPVSAVQAMAAGRAIVTTAPGGVAEQVERGVEALVVPSQDAAALAAALAAVLADGGLRARLGQAAQALFERRFSAASTAAGWAAVYRRAVDL